MNASSTSTSGSTAKSAPASVKLRFANVTKTNSQISWPWSSAPNRKIPTARIRADWTIESTRRVPTCADRNRIGASGVARIRRRIRCSR